MSEFMLNVIENYRNYKSITCVDENGTRLEYDLCNLRITPIGLLRDIALRETKLTEAEKTNVLNVFSAYCMYFAAKRIGVQAAEEIVSFTFIQSAVKCAEKCAEKDTYNGLNRLFTNLLNWRHKDLLRKNIVRRPKRKTDDDSDAAMQPTVKEVPLEIVAEDGTYELSNAASRAICEGALRRMQKAERIKHAHEILNGCLKDRSLSQTQIDMVCHKFGIGKNYELLTQTEIARKLGVSDSHVSETLSNAYRVLREFSDNDSPKAA